MPDGIHPNTDDETREAIIATRERRKQVAENATAKQESGRKEHPPEKKPA